MTLGEWRAYAAKRLSDAGRFDCEYEAKVFVCDFLGVELGCARLYSERELTNSEIELLNEKLKLREAGEPLQYIENEAYFMGLRFVCDKRVLIPRQDTETLCTAALDFMKPIDRPSVLDLCTGSGAIAVSIAVSRPDAYVTATDISRDALSLARENADMHVSRVRFLQGDLFAPVTGESFDSIVCNPPYLTESDMSELQTEVRFEPALALYGGDDGMEFYRRLSKQTSNMLKSGGYALFEVGIGQARSVLDLFLRNGEYAAHGTIKDLCGVDRVIWVRSI